MDHMSDLLHRTCSQVEKELEEIYTRIEKSTQVAPSDIEIRDTLLHSLKSIKTVEAMIESDTRYGYSGSMYPRMTYPDYSGKRDSMGRYSRDTEKEDMMNRLNDMMRDVRTEDEAMAIRNAIDAVSRLR